jgi:SAM-dependent methyltransferase
MVSFPERLKSDEEIKEYYRKDYRPAPNATNLFTGERKLQYHAYFLSTLFSEWKKAGLEAPVIGEEGSAYGMFLNWVKQQFPKADIHGTELTETFRRVAFHEFGIRLAEDFDTSKKYDLIATYHVLEHMTGPLARLKKYRECLKDNGVLYLSCPVWFRAASNTAAPGFDIEWYWAADHINSWTEEHLDYIIDQAGFEPILKDDKIYGNTYILKKSDKAPKAAPAWKPKELLKKAEMFFEMWKLIQENKAAEALALYKNCPTAWITHYELNRGDIHKAYEKVKPEEHNTEKDPLYSLLKTATESCPDSADIRTYAADIFQRYERYDDALAYLKDALKMKPGNGSILIQLSNCFRMKALKSKDEAKRRELLSESINILRFVMATSTEALPQALSWSYHDQALIPVDPV